MQSTRPPRLSRASLAVACVAVVAGCSGESYQFAEVQGTVTVDGKPATGVMLEFAPQRRGDEWPPLAYAITDASGSYVARDRKMKPGAVVGTCRVTITAPEGGAVIDIKRTLGESIFDREVKPGSNTLDFDIKTVPLAAQPR